MSGLSDAEREALRSGLAVRVMTPDPDDSYTRVGHLDDLVPVVESILSARAAALRADIARDIKAFAADHAEPHNEGCVGEPTCVACVWLDAARIALGGTDE